MKKNKINEEIKRMQVIAGIIKEDEGAVKEAWGDAEEEFAKSMKDSGATYDQVVVALEDERGLSTREAEIIASVVFEEDGDARETDKVEEARLSAKEKVDRAITKHLPQLTQLLKDRKRDQEDMDAYEGLEELVGKIAKQVGLSPDEPWMESEWSTGEMSPVKAIKGMREEFIATLEDPDYDASASTDTFDYWKSMGDQYGIKKGGPVKNINKLEEEEIDNTSDEEKIDMWYWDSNPEIENLSQKQIEDGIKAHQEEWLGSKQFYDSIEDYFEDVERQGDWYGNEFDDDDDDLDSEIEDVNTKMGNAEDYLDNM